MPNIEESQNKEKKLFKSIDFGLVRRLLAFLRPYRKFVFLGLLLAIVNSLLSPIRPYLSKIAIDEYIAANDSNGLLIMSAAIFGVLALNGLLMFAMTYMMQWVGQKVLLDIRLRLFEHIQSRSFSFYDKNPVGRLVTRVTNDVEALNELFSSGLVMVLADILLLLWIVGFMFFISAELSLFVLSALPFLIVATFIFKRKVRDTFRDVRAKLAQMNSFLNEFISGISAVKLFTAERSQRAAFDGINSDYRGLMVKTVFYHAVFYPVVELISTAVIAIILWFAGVNILYGALSVGTLIAFLQYAEMFFRPVRDLTEKYTTLQSAMASSERIFGLLDDDSMVRDAPSALPIDSFENEIEFRNVSFSYDGEKQVLKDVSFTVNKGETVAIVGATGAGKTSIISLLSRFYEKNSGEILIDGRRIEDITQKSLREKMAIVMQDVFLFSRTVAENVSLGKPSITAEMVAEAARALGADGFINALPDGFSTMVNERGTMLSAGQRQLLSFCRAYASAPDILILDEATSNIDTATEQLIEQSLEKLLEGKTSIVIAHRLSTIKRADRIIVLHHGQVKESGTHSELIARDGVYARLYRLQYSQSA